MKIIKLIKKKIINIYFARIAKKLTSIAIKIPNVEVEIIEQNKRFFEFFLRTSLPKGYDNKKTAIKFIKKIS